MLTSHMQCMEVWGGSEATDRTVGVAGLDAWIFSQPYEHAHEGGDVYFLSSCATGRVTRLLLADVSGHGNSVAQIAGSLRRLMQRYVNFIDQQSFVRAMNRQFSACTVDGCFATAVVSTFFAPTGDLTLCIAGHPPPLIYRAASRSWNFLNQGGDRAAINLPLGIEEQNEWAQFGVRLYTGDMVLCYTDPLIEARGADDEMIGLQGLQDTVREIDANEPMKIIPRLIESIDAARAGNLEKDDMTILLFRATGEGSRVPFRKRLAAPIRVLGGVVGSYFSNRRRPAPWPEFSMASLGGAMFRGLNTGWSKRNRTG